METLGIPSDVAGQNSAASASIHHRRRNSWHPTAASPLLDADLTHIPTRLSSPATTTLAAEPPRSRAASPIPSPTQSTYSADSSQPLWSTPLPYHDDTTPPPYTSPTHQTFPFPPPRRNHLPPNDPSHPYLQHMGAQFQFGNAPAPAPIPPSFFPTTTDFEPATTRFGPPHGPTTTAALDTLLLVLFVARTVLALLALTIAAPHLARLPGRQAVGAVVGAGALFAGVTVRALVGARRGVEEVVDAGLLCLVTGGLFACLV